jgi:hypothetical protein
MPKPAYTLALLLTALAIPLADPARADAQRAGTLDEPYIAAKLTLGFGGSATMSWDPPLVAEQSASQNVGVAFGLAGQYLYPLHDYFSIGGLLGVQSWRSTGDGDGGRNLVFDLAVLPQGKYELIQNELELNVTVPIGLALNSLNEYDARNGWLSRATNNNAGATFEGDTAFGFVIGFLVGTRYQLAESVGLLAELGYIYRSISHELTPTLTAGNSTTAFNSIPVNVSWGQFALNLGAYF